MTPRCARNRGARVDTHMQILVQAADGNPLKLRYWISSGKRTLADYVEKSKKPLQRPEPFAVAGLNCLLDHDWVPIACQVPVGSALHGIGTAVDVVCKHKTDATRMADIEVKAGYERSWWADSGVSLGAHPLDEMSDCPRNKAHLQIACTGLLHKACTGNKLPEMYVLRISDAQGAQLEPLDEKIKKRLQEVANQLVKKPVSV